MQKKSLQSHNKNKSVLYFTIYFKYFHYEALMSPTWSRRRQHFPETKSCGRRLGGAPGTATLHHLLHLAHKGGPVSAFKRVFPPLAPQRATALPARTAPSALQAGHLLGGLAGGITLLLLVVISYPFPLTRDFSITAVPSVSAAALTVGLPQS